VAQWDVFINPSALTRAELPYLVDMQSDLLSALSTRLVAPLAHDNVVHSSLPRRLSPAFDIQGQAVVMLPQEAGLMDARLLRRPVASLREQSHRLVDALDAVVSGV
jgi:toxin CcdB